MAERDAFSSIQQRLRPLCYCVRTTTNISPSIFFPSLIFFRLETLTSSKLDGMRMRADVSSLSLLRPNFIWQKLEAMEDPKDAQVKLNWADFGHRDFLLNDTFPISFPPEALVRLLKGESQFWLLTSLLTVVVALDAGLKYNLEIQKRRKQELKYRAPLWKTKFNQKVASCNNLL